METIINKKSDISQKKSNKKDLSSQNNKNSIQIQTEDLKSDKDLDGNHDRKGIYSN